MPWALQWVLSTPDTPTLFATIVARWSRAPNLIALPGLQCASSGHSTGVRISTSETHSFRWILRLTLVFVPLGPRLKTQGTTVFFLFLLFSSLETCALHLLALIYFTEIFEEFLHRYLTRLVRAIAKRASIRGLFCPNQVAGWEILLLSVSLITSEGFDPWSIFILAAPLFKSLFPQI
jgi:hypothetical protein